VPVRLTRSAPTPAALLGRVRRDLAVRRDPVRAESTRSYFKKSEPIALYGLSVPAMRALARGYVREVGDAWTVREAMRFASLAVAEREMETKFIGFFVLARFHRDFPRTLAATVRRWLAANQCNNWALVDALSSEVIAPLLSRHPGLLPTVTGWSASKNLWLRRASVVPLASLARRGRHLDEAYAVVTALLDDDQDLIHKATGWILREAGKTDAPRLVAWLRRYGRRTPRTTVRYAIERLPAAQRKRLLAETRPAGRA
jgi:3-methyladenine DNA glycosylase AlkD